MFVSSSGYLFTIQSAYVYSTSIWVEFIWQKRNQTHSRQSYKIHLTYFFFFFKFPLNIATLLFSGICLEVKVWYRDSPTSNSAICDLTANSGDMTSLSGCEVGTSLVMFSTITLRTHRDAHLPKKHLLAASLRVLPSRCTGTVWFGSQVGRLGKYRLPTSSGMRLSCTLLVFKINLIVHIMMPKKHGKINTIYI